MSSDAHRRRASRGPLPADPDPRLVEMEVLFRDEAPKLMRFFRRRVSQSDDAQDLVQEAFARFAGRMDAVQFRNPEAYLQRIARNLVHNLNRARKVQLRASHVEYQEGLAEPLPPDQEFGILARELQRRYHQALAELPERTRAIFLLHRIEAMSYRAIAGRYGIAVSTVEYHMSKALLHLEQALREA